MTRVQEKAYAVSVSHTISRADNCPVAVFRKMPKEPMIVPSSISQGSLRKRKFEAEGRTDHNPFRYHPPEFCGIREPLNAIEADTSHELVLSHISRNPFPVKRGIPGESYKKELPFQEEVLNLKSFP
jgi:hypothetical protein